MVSPVLAAGFWGLAWIANSAALINFNKWLLHAGGFPFPVYLVLFHSVLTSAVVFFCYLAKPSWFPAISGPEKSIFQLLNLSWLAKNAVPLATLFSLQLVLSNTAYLYCSVAFLQMVKEANVFLVYFFSVFAGMEAFRTRNVGVLCFIIASTGLCVHGELRFSMMGFLIQLASQIFESARLTMQGLLLSGSQKLDPLTYTMMVMPFVVILLGLAICLFGAFPWMAPIDVTHPGMADVGKTWHLLLLNGMVAVSLNFVAPTFMAATSALAVTLAGLLKDIVIVCVSGLVLKELISGKQIVGFSLQIAGIGVWGIMKLYPKHFEEGFFQGWHALATAKNVNKADAAAPLKQEGEKPNYTNAQAKV